MDDIKQRCRVIEHEIASLRDRIRTLQAEAEPLLKMLAAAEAPFAVGQTISRQVSWGYRNKKRLERIRIVEFQANGRAKGVRLRADGSDGKTVDVYQYAFEQYTVE